MQEMELMMFVASLFLAAAGMAAHYMARRFKKEGEACFKEAKELVEKPTEPTSYSHPEASKLVLVLDLKRVNTMDYDRTIESVESIENFAIEEYERAVRMKGWTEQADIVKAHISFKRNFKEI